MNTSSVYLLKLDVKGPSMNFTWDLFCNTENIEVAFSSFIKYLKDTEGVSVDRIDLMFRMGRGRLFIGSKISEAYITEFMDIKKRPLYELTEVEAVNCCWACGAIS